MATVTFAVGVPTGEPQGTIDGQQFTDIGSYLALYPTGYTLPNNIIYCIGPDTPIASGMSTYYVQNGITGGLSSTQVNALKGIFSHYLDGGNTSFGAQEITMLADWSIINPSLTVSDVPAGIVNDAHTLVTEALAGTLYIDPNLQFLTLVNVRGHQSFLNITRVTPIPASVGLFMTALMVLAGVAVRRKMARSSVQARH